MGIRPSWALVFGVITDQEVDFDQDEPALLLETNEEPTESNINRHFINSMLKDNLGAPMKLWEVLHQQETDDGRYIFGFKVKRDYDSDLLWTLKAIEEKYEAPGYTLVPSYSSEETTALMSLRAVMNHMKKAGEKLPLSYFRSVYKKSKDISVFRRMGKLGWLYKNGEYHTTILGWADCAKHLFQQVGFKAEEKDTKLILTWDWS